MVRPAFASLWGAAVVSAAVIAAFPVARTVNIPYIYAFNL
jgi:hypothetical protein